MDNNQPQSTAADNPASAFAELRGEVSLLRRAIEGLTAERQNAPDYTRTFKALSDRLTQIEQFIGDIADNPAMRLTPENLAKSIAKASEAARANDRSIVERASTTLQTSIASINDVVDQAWTADRQWKQLCWTAIAGLIIGTAGTISILHW